jgi:photosystem II stability/assembly factor-like uncharacterized protein
MRAHPAVLALALLPATAISSQATDSLTIAGLRWRAIGPASSMGRLSDVVGLPSPSKTLFIAAAAGGIWKSGNNGVTWRPVFDDKRVASMGVLAIAPSDTQVIYAGTGEPNSRYPSEPGGGIYKSNDGGLTWRLAGLEKTQHIGRIVVHPTNPNIVYIAALGAAYGSNPERGLYKTTDGGQTWTSSKFISPRAGFIDVAMDPRNSEVLYAASYERRRTPYMLESGGPGSALWKTTDGGKTWTEITGNGFPTGVKGRIGLAMAPSNPDIVYAMVEAARPMRDGSYAPEYHPIYAGLYRTVDAGRTWTKQNDYNDRPFYYSQVRVDPSNADRVYFSSSPMQVSDDGGKTSRLAAQGIHSDTHGIWIDPTDPARVAIAHDGGVGISFDRGGTFFSPMNLPLTQFYSVSLDNAVPYNVCGGSQDNGAFCGPSRRQGAVSNAYWSLFQGGDMVYAVTDPSDPHSVYTEAVTGNLGRVNMLTGERVVFRKPNWEARYRWWEDSIAALRGDPLTPAPKELAATIASLRAKQRRDSVDLDIRFGWEAAVLVSSHSPTTIYWGGSRLLKSTNRGDDMTLISPDLTKTLAAKIDTSMHLTGGISLETTQTELFGYTTALAESFVKAGLLYAGTDDGNVWVTRNDGVSWENLSGRFPSLSNAEAYVARIEASHFDTLRFYVAFDNHRANDPRPYLYSTTDGGKTFRSIASNLPSDGPADYIHVIREDPHNRNLLFVGTSVAVYVSTDRGGTWSRFMTGMPTTPVYDLAIHPRDRELVAATHGRSFWIADIAPLEDPSPRAVASQAYLFTPKPGLQWSESPTRGNADGHSTFEVNSPPYGAVISYRLGAAVPDGDVRVIVTSAAGDTLATLRGPITPGLHTVVWNYALPAVAGRASTMSASMRRDSILRATRAPFVLDSLAKAGYDSVALGRVRDLISVPSAGGGRGGRSGAGGGRGGRGGGRGAGGADVVTACERPMTQWDPFCARPGEGVAQGPRPNQGPFTSPLVVNNADPKTVLRVFDIIGMSYFNTPGRTFLGSGNDVAPSQGIAPPGDYAVTLVAGEETMRRPLRIERPASAAATTRLP